MPSRLPLLILAAWLGAACGTKPPAPGPLGPEDCTNRKDDNGDSKIDCFDPKCFQDATCRTMNERCDNDVDDNNDTLIDCADPLCSGQACGFDCTCIGGVKVTGSAGGGAGGGSATGGSGGGATGGSGGGTTTGGGSGGGTTTGGGSGGGATTGGGSGGGATGGSGGGTTGGGAGGGATGGSGGGGARELNCADNLDNDADNATDCDDTDCVGVTCGMGCVCALARKTEVNCRDGVDNDGDQRTDCADSDCVGVGTEICDDGIDNNCDRAIDCGDSTCTGALCTGLQDGKPCLGDAQCAGQKCLTEAATGIANGSCTNLNSCTVGTNAGCNGGLCRAGTTSNSCYARCTGTGISGPTACRAGFICTDTDSNVSNGNNYCTPDCADSSECSGSGSGYGCNPWSKRCGNVDRGLGRYGAACTQNAQCETGLCATGPNYPGGYCFGVCRGDTKNCAAGGICSFDASYQDNFGICFQSCQNSPACRQADHYNCWGPASDPAGTCRCLTPGEFSGSNCGLCCSNACSFSTCD